MSILFAEIFGFIRVVSNLFADISVNFKLFLYFFSFLWFHLGCVWLFGEGLIISAMSLILAEEYLRNRDSADTTASTVNVNPIEEKGRPQFQLTEKIVKHMRGFKIRSDGVQGVAVPLDTALLEGCFSP